MVRDTSSGMSDDDDANLALAIANSLRDANLPADQVVDFPDDDNRHTSMDSDVELSRAVEESYRQAKRHRQERDDAEFASDLAAVASLAESELHERRRSIEATDAELASDVAVIDRLAETEMDERQRLALQELSDTFIARRGAERRQGSWDCPVCTFHNRPYASKCGACEKSAPNSVLAFSDLPSMMRFGIELELIVTNGERDGITCQWIADQMSALGVPTKYAGYCHETSPEWKIVTDASLTSSPNDLCFELVSPVLVGEEGLDAVRAMMESVRRIGICINSTCAFHVHVDAMSGPMSSLAGLKRLVHCFVSLEGAFDCLVARDASQHAQTRRANRNRYCRSNALTFGHLSNKQRWNRIQDAQSIHELVNLVNPDTRYHKLNMTNLTRSDRPNTCEFRQHGGCSELLVAEAWIRLILCFCDVTTKDSSMSNICLLRQNAPVKEQLETLLSRVVDCPGIEYFYLLERNLFPLMEMPSSQTDHKREWKCRCGRRFRDCRALAQHSRDTGHQHM